MQYPKVYKSLSSLELDVSIIQSKVTVYANHKINLVLHYFLDLEILTKIGQEFELP